jgi:hypothetical protein
VTLVPFRQSRCRTGPRRAWRGLLTAGFAAVITVSGLAAVPASAATVCTADACVVVPDTLQTPLGLATVTVSTTNVVTVGFVPTTPNTLVIGSPFTLPPVAGCPGGCSRTSISLVTTAGVVNIDTIVFPPGPPGRFTLPNLVIVSLMFPPGPPGRVHTQGTTVVFTPAAVPLA